MFSIGAVFPQTEIGNNPADIRAYARRVEEMGFARIVAYDHVVGAGRATRPTWTGAYDSDTPFHEPFTLFSYLAAVTQSVELMTGVLILPQRQTALVAKQAAEVDVLSGGRFTLGVGVGWNPVEFESLNQVFTDRGARIEEQIAVLRALWKRDTTTFHGRWHTIVDAGIRPRPARGSIPIWFGGRVDAALRRAARLGDGWLPQSAPNETSRHMVERLRSFVDEAGRDPSAFHIQARLTLASASEQSWPAFVEGWRSLGATRLDINTMGSGYTTIKHHLDALQQALEVTRSALSGA